MTPRIKRMWLKGSVLGLIVNGVFLSAQFKVRGQLLSRDWMLAALSLVTTLAALAIIALLFSRFHQTPPK
ncbi:MAG: hypothetical protein EXS38_01580 [Opitutus sp.]|nr:hypothetical protein [Opitutus sp.]